jgi:CDP-glucose 4,6-dehydratase
MNMTWQDRRVVVTGHTGFKGGWLTLWLRQMGAQVTGIGLMPDSERGIYAAARADVGISSYIQDLRDAEAVRRIIIGSEPEIVFHMAAQPLVRLSYEDPLLTYATNVMGTAHVMEAVRHAPSVKAVVVVTSDKCYENREWHWGYRESDRLGGHDPYSNSKACTELVTAAYRSSYFKPNLNGGHAAGVATVRAGNVIGGGDWAADRLIPDLMRSIESGSTTQVRSPYALRPWQHVLEPLSGYLLLAEHLLREPESHAQAWNFGPEESDVRPVRWLVEQLSRTWGEGINWLVDDRPHPHEATYLKLDSSLAKARLGWRQRWCLEQTVDAIVEWHQALLEGRDMRALSLDQIGRYCAS